MTTAPKPLALLLFSLLAALLFNSCRNPVDPTDNFRFLQGEMIPNTEYFISDKLPFSGIDATPKVSPNGQLIAYRRLNDVPRDSAGVYILDLTTGQKRLLVSDLLAMLPDWSPDSEWLALNIGQRIFKVRKNGSNLTQLTFPTRFPEINYASLYDGSEFFPAWSPDGTEIAYQYNIDYRTGKGGIYILKADGSQQNFLQHRLLFVAAEPNWHPSGEGMLGIRGFSATNITTQFPVFSLKTNRTEKILSGTENESNASAQYSPDGTRILFWNTQGIWVMNSDGSNLKRLLPTYLSRPNETTVEGEQVGFVAGQASWYPDGKHIVFEQLRVTRIERTPRGMSGRGTFVSGFISLRKLNVDEAITASNL